MDATQALVTNNLLTAQRRASESVQDHMANTMRAQQARIRQLEVALAQKESELSGVKMGLAGCVAQAKALKGALQKVAPTHALFAAVGGTYPDGSKRVALDVFYENAVDAKAKELKLPVGVSYRPVAK